MIYFDNGATTFPKPPAVRRAVTQALQSYGANPGRSGHSMSVRAGEVLYECRKNAAKLLGAEAPEKIIFTLNCTAALNTVIHGTLKRGDHAVISSLEHNAVLRPLEAMKQEGVSYSVAAVAEGDEEQTLDSFRRALQSNTKLVICTGASNVFGVRLPVERIAALCRLYGILFCLDAAQTAGCVPINMQQSGFDFVCCAGHKGLYGPMGTGLLAVNTDRLPDSLVQGGTGSDSANPLQPDILPDKYESGTPNLPGIAGLNEGIRFVLRNGEERLLNAEMKKAQRLYDGLSHNKHVVLYTARPDIKSSVPVISFNVKGRDSEETAAFLNDRFQIAVRAGLHCAPLAHRSFGTQDSGTVRAVISAFNTDSQIAYLVQSLQKKF